MDWTFSGEDGVWVTQHQQWPTTFSKTAAEGLYSMGRLFLYGATSHALFEFADPIKRAAAASAAASEIETTGLTSSSSLLRRRRNNDDVVTIAVHSRHPYDEIDGCDVQQGLDCVEQLLLPLNSTTSSLATPSVSSRLCRVWVMPDRQCTLGRLQEAQIVSSSGSRCMVHFVSHNDTTEAAFEPQLGQHHFAKHGPFAGAGHFVKLLWVSSEARDGVVVSLGPNGLTRSSPSLLMELVKYNRKMEAWESSTMRSDDPKAMLQQHNLSQCKCVPLNPQVVANKMDNNTEIGV